MYSLHLSPEQLQIRDTVRDFVAQEIKPLALAPQQLEASARPILMQALDQASHIGLRTLALSEEAAGARAHNHTLRIVTEEVAGGAPHLPGGRGRTPTLAPVLLQRLMTHHRRGRL